MVRLVSRRGTASTCALLTALLLISSDSAPAQSDEGALRSELAKVVESLNSGGGSAALDFFSDHYVTESTRFHLEGDSTEDGTPKGWKGCDAPLRADSRRTCGRRFSTCAFMVTSELLSA